MDLKILVGFHRSKQDEYRIRFILVESQMVERDCIHEFTPVHWELR